ncbi:MAG: radical SAM protein [Caldisericia bacterium]|nr:radical SAM protein [Caldisericia bacterium]
MKTFEKELLNIPKWRNNSFIEQQIFSHFQEIKDLITENNPHKYNEITDLINILSVYLENNQSEEELSKIYEARKSKFIEKSKRKREWRISLTENCNYRCFFCHEEGLDMESERKEPKTIEDIYNLVKEGINLGYTDITFTGGEPLIRKKDIIDIMDRLSFESLFPDITIVTNGYLIDDSLLDAIKKYKGNFKFNFSLHAVDEENYYNITNPKNNDKNAFTKVKENIKKIKDRNIELKTNFVLLKGLNTDEKYINKIIEFAITYKVDYVKFLELLITEKLSKFYNYYFETFSLENILKNEIELIKKEDRRKVFRHKKSNLLLELQMCTCKVGCNKCLQVRDKTITSELKYYPCFVLNSEPIDINNINELDTIFEEGDKIIIDMAKKYKNNSPIIVKSPVYLKSKTDFYYKTDIKNIEELTNIMQKSGFQMSRKTSIEELYFVPKEMNDEWKNFNKILKLFSVKYEGNTWKEVLQNLDYVKEPIFHTKTYFFSETKPKIIDNLDEYKKNLSFLDFEILVNLNWEITFFENENISISIAENLETKELILRTENLIENREIMESLNLKVLEIPLLKHIMILLQNQGGV